MEQESFEHGQLEYYKIGGVIRKFRKEKDLKLLDLAAITGIKSAMLSKIENGRMIPTIPTLFTIMNKLGIRPEHFFSHLYADNTFPGYLLLPKETFAAYEKEEGAIGFQYQSILESSHDGGAFQISLLTLFPGSNRPQVTTAAYEFIYVLEGSLEYQLEDKTFEMDTGDALFFDGNIAHVPINSKNKMVRLLVLYLFTDNNK
ncbi:transcriptional regulator, XRE family with cupin sensor [Chitinophaga jiangningensis]|uniref:Transcriptional regulator, XRE family with cupin sensor n=1 Tax=Chitinophaga jiangningensis TaxID=1419482 RepID=A0A1M7C3X3_9BACT|nr:XRE family transcriptional regulator [Chitinophaga jiangningensis]SHL61836.1 transcriptional regulator, XRE family with cupin sensor [Chitinophaga jiangningensis]